MFETSHKCIECLGSRFAFCTIDSFTIPLRYCTVHALYILYTVASTFFTPVRLSLFTSASYKHMLLRCLSQFSRCSLTDALS